MTTQVEHTAQHTAGPWRVDTPTSPDSIGQIWATDSADYIADVWTHTADAQLIAAAPELLAAVKLAFEYTPFHADACNGVVEYEEGVIFDTTRDCDCFIAKMRAAIAKAEGRDS